MLTSRPTVFEVEVTAAGEAIKFTMPENATWFSIKLRSVGGAVKWSHTGTEGEALVAPYATLEEGEGFSLPDVPNFSTTSISDIYFDDNGGDLPAVVEIVVT